MKYISFIVPCYNSQEYMRRCIDSLLLDERRVEIILVDDGSTDLTGTIADEYVVAHPQCIRVIHQKNRGHGGAVNAGLGLAEGVYVKVVDSDDWLEKTALYNLLKTLDKWLDNRKNEVIPDLVVTDYCYRHRDSSRNRVIDYQGVFPGNTLCRWEDTGSFGISRYLIMHALTYRRTVLERANPVLPDHTFYVDNILASQPLPFVHTIRYLNLNLYQYCLDREDQSVNEKVMISRIDQQIRVTKLVADQMGTAEVRKAPKKLQNYLGRNVSIMVAISDIHLLMEGSGEAMEKRRQLWKYIRKRDVSLYRFLKYRTISGLTNLPGKAGKVLTLGGYRISKKIYQFQ